MAPVGPAKRFEAAMASKYRDTGDKAPGSNQGLRLNTFDCCSFVATRQRSRLIRKYNLRLLSMASAPCCGVERWRARVVEARRTNGIFVHPSGNLRGLTTPAIDTVRL